MLPPPPVQSLDDDILDEFYDRGAVHRGRGYADDGRVKLLQIRPGRISGVCRGSGRATYVTSVEWSEDDGGFVDIVDSCSCPIGNGCKHCVALILTTRRQAEVSGPTARGTTPAPAPTNTWRQVLAGLGGPEADADVGFTDLGLELTVNEGPPNRYAATNGPRLMIRPMRRGRSGKWVKTGAAWRDVASPYGPGPAEFDPKQTAALRALVASGRIVVSYGSAPPPSLDQFSPDLWFQLERAVDVGIELIGARPDDVIELVRTAAHVLIDLAADASGTLTLSTEIVLDDEALTLEGGQSGLLGTPTHGLWIRSGNRLRLVPLAAPLDPAVRRLVTNGVLTVPAPDVDEVLDVYQPQLARHASVGSADGSVTITTNRFDGIVVRIARTSIDAANLQWSVRYRRGDRITDHPLAFPAGRSRDRRAEMAATTVLKLPTHLLPTLAGPDGLPRDITVSGPTLVTLLTEVVPWLETNTDIEVEVHGDQPALREATTDPLISLTVADGSDRTRGTADDRDGTDWFDLGVEVSVDGQTIDFVSLFAALNRDEEMLILPSGTWLRLDQPELAKLRELINEARGLADPNGDGVARISPFQTSWWDELMKLGVVAEQSSRWADRIGRMASLTAPEAVEPPAALDATLRHYQQEGLDWLVFLHRNQLGGVLADDMGLGKTVQTLALALHIIERDPTAKFLVVAPTSVVENWAREAARFAPSLAVRTISETASRRGTSLDDEIAGAHLVVTSYALFRIEHDDYAAHGWELLLLDEAQFVKNHQGKTYQCARRLDAATKIAITGTPLENSLMDLWSLLSITAPGLFPDPKRFSETYRKPIERGDAPELLATLRRRIAPLMRRRTKDAVLTELPPKTEQTVEVALDGRHARIYSTQLQRQRQKVLGLVGDVQKNRFEIFKSLTLLRQLALDPGLIDEKHANVGSAKLDRLLDDLTQIVAEGHRALVFSQFTRFLARVRTRLDDAGIEHSYLDGRTRKRDAAIARFKDGDVPVFVISLKAGGFGLNLTEADYCFILDPWWNPATETQAVDRTHRMGQQNPVMVYRYVSTGTIEEKVMELKARKADLFSRVMDGEGALAGALTEDDIRGLLDLG